MIDETKGRKYLVIIQLDDSSDMRRLSIDVPPIVDIIERLSIGKPEQVFRSKDGILFGYFAKSASPTQFFRAEFDKSSSTNNKDTILIIEVGDTFNGLGFSRAWTWLQHH